MRVRYALAALVGPWASLVVLGLTVAVAASRDAEYLGEDVWTVRWMALGLWIVWPIVAAAAAADAARASALGSRHLAVPLELRARDYAWRAAWTAGPAVVVHAMVVLSALVVGGVLTPRVGWWSIVLAIAAQCVTIVFAAALGSWVGRHIPALVAGAVAGAVMLGVGSYLTNVRSGTPSFVFLGDTGASVSQIGVVWNPTHLWWQLGLVGAGAVLLVLALPRVRSSVVVPSLWGVGIVAAVGAVGMAAPSVVPGEPLLATGAEADECRFDTVTVCYFPEHRAYVGPTEMSLSRLADAAEAGGYGFLVPEKAVERSRRIDHANGTTIRSFGPLAAESNDITDLDVIADILTPTWCEELSEDEPPPEQFWRELESLAFTWAVLAGTDRDTLADRFFESTTVLEPDEAVLIVEAHARCDLDGRR